MAAIVHADGRVEIVRDVVGLGDPRLADARDPNAHAATHVDGGTDEITSRLDPRATAILVDDLANRPAASIANSGRFFYAQDTDTLFVNDPGGAWIEVSAPYLHAALHSDGGADEITSALDPRAYPVMQGNVAGRPAATVANAGRLYWADDEHILYINDGGGTWKKAAVADYNDLDTRSVVNADVNGFAAIAYSKLDLNDSIIDADIFSLAAIAYSKLNLAGSIKDSDFSTVLADRPSGDVLTHNEVTSVTAISATTEASANNIVAASAFTFDGSTAVIIEAFFPDANAIGAWTCNFVLWDNTAGASIGLLGSVTLAAGALSGPLLFRRRLTPANGSRTYSIRAFRGTANGNVNAGAGGVGAKMPGYIRITKA